NVVFFFASPVSDLNLGLHEQLSYQPYSPWARELVDARLAGRGIDLDAYSAAYSNAGDDVAKAIVLWHVPVLALFWLLLFVDRRLYYAEHFVAALHSVAYIRGAALLLQWVVRPPLGLMLGWFDATPSPGLMTMLLLSLVLLGFY